MPQSVIVEGRINGIDVSSANAIKNPKLIKEAGFEFVYIQSSRYSSTPELSFERTRDQMLEAGLRVGAYHYCSHDTDPVKQAEFFYKASRGLGSKPGELPPMVDWEFCTPTKYKAPSYPEGHPQHCVDWVTQNLQAVTKLWYPDNAERLRKRYPVLYTYPAYSGGHQPALKASGLNVYPLCYASYKADPLTGKLVAWLPLESQGPLHAIPAPFRAWVLWQYSGNQGLPVPGINGYTDRQLFCGSTAEFDEFCGIYRSGGVSVFEVKDDAVPRV